MDPLINGLEDCGMVPLRADLGRESMGGLLLKKRGGWVACRDRRWRDRRLLVLCNIFKEGGLPSNFNACCICVGNKGVGGCGVCAHRSRVGGRRGGVRGGGGVSGLARRVGCIVVWVQDRDRG